MKILGWLRTEPPPALYEWVDDFGEVKGSCYDSPEEAERWRQIAQQAWAQVSDSPTQAALLERWTLREMART